MRTRILFLIAAFAFQPACKKGSSPSPLATSEQISAAENEIKQVAEKIGGRTHDLEVTKDPARAIFYKSELDDLKAELIAVREKNKDIIPMDRSNQLANSAIQETKAQIERIVADVNAESQARQRQDEKEMRDRFDRENEESRKKMMNEIDKPFKLTE